jgi:hypothetical protein
MPEVPIKGDRYRVLGRIYMRHTNETMAVNLSPIGDSLACHNP